MYRDIMLAVDNSASARRATQEAARMAALTRALVHVVYVVDTSAIFNYGGGYYDPQALTDALRAEGRDALAHAHATLLAAGVDDRQEMIETDISDHVETALQQYAVRCGADLVVMGTHGRRGVQRLVLGSVAERFLRFSTCPVMLVRAQEEEAPS